MAKVVNEVFQVTLLFGVECVGEVATRVVLQVAYHTINFSFLPCLK